MKVFITGGAGFIGSHIVEALVREGHDVCVYDDFSTGSPENLSAVSSKIDIVAGDILDREKLLFSMKGADAVSHQAAQLEIFRAVDDPYFDLRVNTVGTLNVLLAAQTCGVQRVVNASSACVYGQTNEICEEDKDLRPNWAYGVSKLAAEKYGNLFNDYHGIPTVSLRYGIVYGEREWFRRVLTIFIKRALEGKEIVVFGAGDQRRDFVYVKDVVELHQRCLFSERATGEVFNAGTGKTTSIIELARMVSAVHEQETGRAVPVIHEDIQEGDFSELVPDKRRNTAELKCMWLSPEKAKKLLEWEPRVQLMEGIRNEWRWARSSLKRWGSIHYSKARPEDSHATASPF